MNNTQLTTTSARVLNFLKALRLDRRGAELVEVLIVLAIVALGGLAAVRGIQSSTKAQYDKAKTAIDGINVPQ